MATYWNLLACVTPAADKRRGGMSLSLSPQNCGGPRPPAPSRGCGEHTISGGGDVPPGTGALIAYRTPLVVPGHDNGNILPGGHSQVTSRTPMPRNSWGGAQELALSWIGDLQSGRTCHPCHWPCGHRWDWLYRLQDPGMGTRRWCTLGCTPIF